MKNGFIPPACTVHPDDMNSELNLADDRFHTMTKLRRCPLCESMPMLEVKHEGGVKFYRVLCFFSLVNLGMCPQPATEWTRSSKDAARAWDLSATLAKP